MADIINIDLNTDTGRTISLKVIVTGGYTVYWSDGIIENYASNATATHTYTSPNTGYNMSISPQILANRFTQFRILSSSCINLQVTLNASALTNASNMFNSLGNALISFTSSTTLNSVTTISLMFYGCTAITSIILPSMSNLGNAEYCFYNCTALTTVSLPASWSSVNSIQGVFMNCTALTTVTLPTMANLLNMTAAFEGCNILTTISNLNGVNTLLTDITYAFYGCTMLTTFTFPATLNEITNVAYLFTNCTALTTVTLPSMTGVTLADYTFYGCTALTTLSGLSTFGSGATAKAAGTSGTNFISKCVALTGSLDVSKTAWKQFWANGDLTHNMNITDIVFDGTLNKWDDSNGYSIVLDYGKFSGTTINTIVNRLPAGAARHISVDYYWLTNTTYTNPLNGWNVFGWYNLNWITPVTSWIASNYYNFGDLNRIESNTTYINNALTRMGYSLSLAAQITNRTMSSFDFYDSVNRIENNILLLEAGLGFTPTGWVTPIINWTYGAPFSYTDANRLEVNLNGMYNNINNINAEVLYAGQSLAICGYDWKN